MKKSLQYYSIALAFTLSGLTGCQKPTAHKTEKQPESYPVTVQEPTAQAEIAPKKSSNLQKKTTLKKKLQSVAANAAKKRKAVKTKIAQNAEKRFIQASGIAHNLVNFGLAKIGSPYVWGGTSEAGFDCSGFVTYVFGQFQIDVPHSSSALANTGDPVARKNAKPGDILIFTGTNPKERSPGHVGIVISNPGETLEFVHASSNGGVKVSQVENTNYERRFLEVRRVL